MTRSRAAFLAPILLVLAGCKQSPAPSPSAAESASANASEITTTTTAASGDAPSALPPVTTSGTKLTWLGHAAFKLDTPSGKILYIDPWIQNPKNPDGKKDLAAIDKADLILVTHAHFDHVGDAVAIGKKTKAKLVSTFDLGSALKRYGGYPKDGVGFDTQGNFGGEISLLDGEVSVTFVPAVHGSTFEAPGKAADDADLRPGGQPGGFLISVKNGPTIYHTGDTDLFADMALIPQKHPVTVMLTTIGDHFTMGPDRAADAVKLVHPAIAVPMHYGTFPVLTGTAEAFTSAVTSRKLGTQVKVLQLKETLAL